MSQDGRNWQRDSAAGPQLAVGLAFIVALGGAVGFIVVYGTGGQPQLEGLLLGGALLGLAIGIGTFAHRLLPFQEETEEREQMTSADDDRDAVSEGLSEGLAPLTARRTVLGLFGVAGAALVAALVVPLRGLGPAPLPRLRTTAWRRGLRLVDAGTDEPVRATDLAIGEAVTAYPEGAGKPADSVVLVLRIPEGSMAPAPGRPAAAPDGYAVFSKVCTHAGCPVGLFQAATLELVCPCHQSIFDVAQRAEPTFGPAARPLPQLPVDIDEQGYLRATDDFDQPVGPSFWSRK